jgi:hypothetical protein
LTVVFAAAVAQCFLAVPPADAKRSSCNAKGSKTVAASTTARVVVRRGRLWGCLKRLGHAVPLDGARGRDDGFLGWVKTSPVRLAGNYVAYTATWCCAGSGAADFPTVEVVRVVNLYQRAQHLAGVRVKQESDAWSPHEACLSPETCGSRAWTTDLVLNRRGAVAWVSCEGDELKDGCMDSPTEWSVFAIPSTQPGRSGARLDFGTSIDSRSLTLVGREVRWTHGDQPRSAPLD